MCVTAILQSEVHRTRNRKAVLVPLARPQAPVDVKHSPRGDAREGAFVATWKPEAPHDEFQALVVESKDPTLPIGTILTYQSRMGHILCKGEAEAEGGDSCKLHPWDLEYALKKPFARDVAETIVRDTDQPAWLAERARDSLKLWDKFRAALEAHHAQEAKRVLADVVAETRALHDASESLGQPLAPELVDAQGQQAQARSVS